MVAVNHKPLLGILGKKEQDRIKNPRLAKLKEKTLNYKFQIIYVSGVKNRVADAVSRFPAGDSDQD